MTAPLNKFKLLYERQPPRGYSLTWRPPIKWAGSKIFARITIELFVVADQKANYFLNRLVETSLVFYH